MYKHLTTHFTEILDIKQYKGNCVCSKERFEAFEPHFLYEQLFSTIEHRDIGTADILIRETITL